MNTTTNQENPVRLNANAPNAEGVSAEEGPGIGNEKSLARANDDALAEAAPTVERTGANILRYGLVGILATMGAMKFTDYEAKGIAPLLKNSPLFSAATNALGVRTVARAIGVSEIAIAALIALRPRSARLSALGSGLAVAMFGTTLSFIASTPGSFTKSARGIPVLSSNVGQFLVKDVILLGAAVWSLGEALRGRRSSARRALPLGERMRVS